MAVLNLIPINGLGFINLVVASLILGAIGCVVARFARRESLLLQHHLISVALLLIAASPISSGIASVRGRGLIQISGRSLESTKPQEANDIANLQFQPVESYVNRTADLANTSRVEPSKQESLPIEQRRIPIPSAIVAEAPIDRDTVIQSVTQNFGIGLMFVWAAGAACIAFRLINGLRSVWRLQASLKTTRDDRLIRAATKAFRAAGLDARTSIQVSSLAPAPLTIGWWNCIVVVPSDLTESLDDQELVCVLAHEAAHVARRDTLFAVLQQLLMVGFWWNPFVRALNDQSNSLREQICDDHVVKLWGNGLSLAHAIVKVMERATIRTVPLPFVATLLDGFDEVATRIKRLVKHDRMNSMDVKKSSFAIIGLISVMSLAVPFVPLFRAQVEAAPDDVEEQEGWHLRVRALDANGQPISKARIGFQLAQGLVPQWTLSDDDGQATLQIPAQTPRFCQVLCRAHGFVTRQATWQNPNQSTDDPLPDEITFEMKQGATVGGLVLNEDGKAVAGAKVLFMADDPELNHGQRVVSICREEAVTNAAGEWRSSTIPPEATKAWINVSHRDYALDRSNTPVFEELPDLLKLKHSWTLKRGFRLSGRIVDDKGQPVARAALALCRLNLPNIVPIEITDEDGRYEFNRISVKDEASADKDPIGLTLTVVKQGFRPIVKTVPGYGKVPLGESGPQERTLDFALKKGVTFSLKVTDAKKQPIKGAWVIPASWLDTRGLESLRNYGIPNETNEEGLWIWNDAPPGESIQFTVQTPGYSLAQHAFKIEKKGGEVDVVLTKPQIVIGKVIDAKTKKPVSKFVVERAFENVGGFPNGLFWTSDKFQGRDGEYRGTVAMVPHNGRYTYRVLAEGYQPAVSKSTPFEEGETTIDFELQPTKK